MIITAKFQNQIMIDKAHKIIVQISRYNLLKEINSEVLRYLSQIKTTKSKGRIEEGL